MTGLKLGALIGVVVHCDDSEFDNEAPHEAIAEVVAILCGLDATQHWLLKISLLKTGRSGALVLGLTCGSPCELLLPCQRELVTSNKFEVVTAVNVELAYGAWYDGTDSDIGLDCISLHPKLIDVLIFELNGFCDKKVLVVGTEIMDNLGEFDEIELQFEFVWKLSVIAEDWFKYCILGDASCIACCN